MSLPAAVSSEPTLPFAALAPLPSETPWIEAERRGPHGVKSAPAKAITTRKAIARLSGISLAALYQEFVQLPRTENSSNPRNFNPLASRSDQGLTATPRQKETSARSLLLGAP